MMSRSSTRSSSDVRPPRAVLGVKPSLLSFKNVDQTVKSNVSGQFPAAPSVWRRLMLLHTKTRVQRYLLKHTVANSVGAGQYTNLSTRNCETILDFHEQDLEKLGRVDGFFIDE